MRHQETRLFFAGNFRRDSVAISGAVERFAIGCPCNGNFFQYNSVLLQQIYPIIRGVFHEFNGSKQILASLVIMSFFAVIARYSLNAATHFPHSL